MDGEILMVDIKKLHFANFFKVFDDPNDMQNNELAFDSTLRLIYKDEEGNLHPILSVSDYKNIYNPDSISITQKTKSATVGVGEEGDFSDKISRSMPLLSKVTATDIHNRVMLVHYDSDNNLKDLVLFPDYFCKLNGYADEIDINKGIMTEYVKKVKILESLDQETLSNNKIFKIFMTETEDVRTSLNYPLTIEDNKDDPNFRDHMYIGTDGYLYIIKDKETEDLKYPFWFLNRRNAPASVKVDTTMFLLDKNDKFVFESYRKVVDIIEGNSYQFIGDDEDYQILKVLAAVKTTIYGIEKVDLKISADKKSVIGLEDGAHYSITVITNEPFTVPTLNYQIIDIAEGFFGYLYRALKDINDNEQRLPLDVIESLTETVRLSLIDYIDERFDEKADLDSPEFIGTPTAPTPPKDDNSERLATTEYVLGQASDENPLMDGEESPGTSSRYSREDHVHPTDTSRAPVESPEFTGEPKAPTPPKDDNSKRLATTEYVLGQASDENPLMDGNANAGTSSRYSREDHVHPTDTSRAPVNSPEFTGLVKTPDVDVQGNNIYNVANIPVVNLLGDSGRFMGKLLDPYSIESSYPFENINDFFGTYNNSIIAPAGKFINNNSDNGGNRGSLNSDVKELLDVINDLTGKSKRYGSEFYVASITQGNGTEYPHDVNDHHYILTINNRDFSGSGRFFTFSAWIRLKDGDGMTIKKSFKLYKNGVEVNGDYLELTTEDDWVHIQSVILTDSGYDKLAPYLYAPGGAVVQIALPVITAGGTGVGIHSAPIPKSSTGFEAAPTDSPVFTGNVILPYTTTIGDVTPEEISYLSGLTDNIQTQLNKKIESDSPEFIGTPTAPTAPVDTNNKQIATTEFVINQAGNSDPLMDGEADAGTSTRFAREDHVHPTDTSRAPIDSPVFTGNVKLPETTVIGDISYAQLSFLNGLVGNIQDQLDEKVSSDSPTLTGDVYINGNLNVENNIETTSLSFKNPIGPQKLQILYNEDENSIDFVLIP